MTAPVVIGLDLGTSSLKGVAVTLRGEVVAQARATYPTVRDGPGQAEQEPRDWWRALEDVVRGLSRRTPGGVWAGLGLSAMIPTLVASDADGDPLGRAVTWEDGRAAAEGEAFRTAAGTLLGDEANGLYRRTGQWVDGRYLIPQWERWKTGAKSPEGARPLAAKDHLFRELTGEIATDPSTAAGFGAYDLERGRWLTEAATSASAAGIGLALPQVLPSLTTRPLAQTAAHRLDLPAGLPVCLGAADSVLAALALGAVAPGDVAYVTGTSTVILGVAASPALDPRHRYLVTPLAAGRGWGLEMDLISTGSAVQWLSRLLGLGEDGQEQLIRLAAEAAPGVGELQIAPFLGGGEQGALWDDRLRGAVLGLGLESGPADLARALLVGIVLESRRCLDVLADAGVAGPVRAAGEGMASAFLRRQLADATRRQVESVRGPSPSALGAALLTARAIGALRNDETWVRSSDRTTPDARAAGAWDERWLRHEALVARLQKLYRDLPSLPG